MGNQLVIPSQADWYEEPLRKMKITVKNSIDSGTFLLTLDCVNQYNEPLIVKAYEYTESLEKGNLGVDNSRKYFNHLTDKIQATQCIIDYSNIIINDRYAFLIRPKKQYTLPQRLEEYPRLEEIEKRWVVFQIYSAISSLHSINLVHGALNPDNIFVDWDISTTVGDLAPFKPTQIRADKPNVYHHYFSTSTRNGCYLAPEQIITEDNVLDPLFFSNLKISADLFSIGCIVYYLYTGTHLFNFSTLIQFKEGKFNLDAKLQALPDKIRNFARTLLDIDPNSRQEVNTSLSKYFPPCFRQIFDQFIEFSTNDGSLTHLVTMIPVFDAMVDDQDVKVRVILTNLFAPFILTSDDYSSVITFSYFLAEFASVLSEEIILCRILPNFIGLLSIENNTIKTTGLRCIVKLLVACKTINNDLASIIQNYLISEVNTLAHKGNNQVRIAVAETAPKLIHEILRLIPDFITDVQSVLNFIISESDPLVIQAFLYGLNECCENGVKLLENLFPILLSSFNHSVIQYKAGILQTFMKYYEVNTSLQDQKTMMKLLKSLAPATIGFLQHETNPEMRNHFLAFLDWYNQQKFMDEDMMSDIFTAIGNLVDSKDAMTQYYVNSIVSRLPDRYKEVMLPHFVLRSINKHGSVPTLQEISEKFSKLSEPNIVAHKLISSKRTKLNPKFLLSTRVSKYPIRDLATISSESIAALTKEGISILSSTSTDNVHKIPCQYKSFCSLAGKNSLVVSDLKMTSILDVATEETTEFCKGVHRILKSISSTSFIGASKGVIAQYDTRVPKVIRYLTFNDLTVADVCKWSASPIIGVGFKEGIVDIIDLRAWTPSSMVVTPPVETVTPIAGGTCSIFVSSSLENSAIFDCSSNSMLASINADGLAVGYCGRAVLAGNRGTFFIDLQGSYRLNENSYSGEKAIPLPFADKLFDCSGVNYAATLHGHTARITSIAKDKRFFTGDEVGFVNIWSVTD
ncbi:CAMK family protein kinase [Trichomonas vaginalis G3]|uniref:non-specific serine/threonine protein kinase n=1 Tax=Trichomonas vaginalis (strain ATCC PRA-98 / G3) TaxID=412133 RepID=A2F986_TRIV3|nr:autophagy of peroxisome [Trichomonas vaginalis G3]EAX98509.1 CAMK family protein kinase [Trichomonas vaginalis G3]KAI5529342.1 autophagy of peroxisome [Trichomonas vaginalis G3]|eukprot:XP_001311439.1 CAMK family protein kinase [Trichomonas vaginalis G3]